MSPERRSSNDAGRPGIESSNVIFSATAHEPNHVLVHPHNHPNLSHSMNTTGHPHHPPTQHHLHQHQLLHQNGISVTSVHSGTTATNGHHSITTSTHHLANDSYATVMTLSTSVAASTSSSTLTTAANSATTAASKILVLHPNQLNDSFKSSEFFCRNI